MSHQEANPALPNRARFRRALLRWFDRRRRDLPWRRTKDPYAVVVSEFMLQQTQVSTAAPYFERFMERFPTPEALDRAAEEDVLGAWAGLGYYRRARQLKRLAREVCAGHGGRIPADCDALLALPGLGPYAAAAVASIAFGIPRAALDGNVVRVVARLLCEAGDPTRAPARERLREAAQALLAPRRPGDFNQAMMELGALVCRPRNPGCAACPVRGGCAAFSRGEQALYPALPPRRKTVAVEEWGALVLRRGKLLWLQRPGGARWGGMWEIPRLARRPGEAREDGLRRAARELAGLEGRCRPEGFDTRYTFTHHRIVLACGWVASPRGPVRLGEHCAFRWASPGEAAGLPLSSAQRRIAKKAAELLSGGSPPCAASALPSA